MSDRSDSPGDSRKEDAADHRYLQQLKDTVVELRRRCFLSSKADFGCEELYWHLSTLLGLVGVGCSAMLSYLSMGSSYPRLKPTIGIASAVATGILTTVQPGTLAADFHAAGVNYEEFEARVKLLEMEIDHVMCREAFEDIPSLKRAVEAVVKEKADLDMRSRAALNFVVQYTKWLHKKPV